MNEHDTFRSGAPSGDDRTSSSTTAAEAPPESTGQGPAPRLVRFPDEGPGAGVAAGLGAYFGLDPVFFRIAFLMLAFAGGSGVLLYGIGWLVIPAAAPGQTTGRQVAPPSDRTAQWVGIGLIVAAVFWLTGPFDAGGPALWALALIAIGVMLFREDAHRRSREAAGGGSPDGGTAAGWSPAGSAPGGSSVEPGAGGPPAGAPPSSGTPTETPGDDDAVDDEEAVLEEAARLRERELQGWSAGGWEAGGPPSGGGPPDTNWARAPQVPPAPGPAPRRSILGRGTLGVALVAVGILALAENLSGALAVPPATYAAMVMAIVGGGLLVGAWWGRARGLIPVGLLLLPFLAAASLFPFGPPWDGSVGERAWHPTGIEDVRDEYELGAGQLLVDLSEVDFAGHERTVSASVGLGQLEVVVPEGVDVTVNASTGAGELELLGESDRGSGLERTVNPPVSGPVDGSLTLDLESGFGQVTVSRTAR